MSENENIQTAQMGPFIRRIAPILVGAVAVVTLGACSISSTAEDGPKLPDNATYGQVIQKCTDFIANYKGSDQAQLYATCMATAKALIEKGP